LPELIFFNGPSSSGKTTLCRALQSALSEPYLCIGFEDFIFLSAPRYYLGGATEPAGCVAEILRALMKRLRQEDVRDAVPTFFRE